ncbi:hypothetical protein Q5Y75_26885 [Ruegeria sp. 2205SS24-7]|uniref:DUF6714 family protein n=1 Tax=Ruegeria discodermiae TaxID=3064389 RepID=UPI00274065E9|nr:DUF6714 family protein [Ruegeria sp. 2205SS24-7]MDP5220817.1 hypothetical protein [Ruegeria sp. 2205SS24-7]
MSEESAKTDALATLIKAAFDGLDPPSDDELLHPDCIDDVDILEFYGGIRLQEMTDHLIVDGYAAPTAFSARAFRYFLPAYLMWALRNPDSPEHASESILLALDPGTSKEMLHDFRVSKFSLFTIEQKDAVQKFLYYFADHPSLGEFADAALLNYWSNEQFRVTD